MSEPYSAVNYELQNFLKENKLSHLEGVLAENGIGSLSLLRELVSSMKDVQSTGISVGDGLQIRQALNLKAGEELKEEEKPVPMAYPIQNSSVQQPLLQNSTQRQPQRQNYTQYRPRGQNRIQYQYVTTASSSKRPGAVMDQSREGRSPIRSNPSMQIILIALCNGGHVVE